MQGLNHFRLAYKLAVLLEIVMKHTVLLAIVSAKFAGLISISIFVRFAD